MMIIEIPKPCQKFTARTSDIKKIVIHDTAGLFPGCLTWLQNTPPLGSADSSAHVIITRNADVFRLIPDELKAWHCRGHNDDSIGIELERHQDDETGPYPESQLEAAAYFVAARCKKHHIPLNKIYAHADLDPQRRRDPRTFPWEDFLIRVAEILLNGELL